MRSTLHLNPTQFSTASLLAITLLCAMSFALAQYDALLVPLVFPFTLGALTAHRATPTKYSLVLGTVFSLCCLLIGIGPFVLVNWFLVRPIAWIDERLLTRSLFVATTMFYFALVSMLGGYVGGIAARTD